MNFESNSFNAPEAGRESNEGFPYKAGDEIYVPINSEASESKWTIKGIDEQNQIVTAEHQEHGSVEVPWDVVLHFNRPEIGGSGFTSLEEAARILSGEVNDKAKGHVA